MKIRMRARVHKKYETNLFAGMLNMANLLDSIETSSNDSRGLFTEGEFRKELPANTIHFLQIHDMGSRVNLKLDKYANSSFEAFGGITTATIESVLGLKLSTNKNSSQTGLSFEIRIYYGDI